MNHELEGIGATKRHSSISRLSSTTKASMQGVESALEIQSNPEVAELEKVNQEISTALQMMSEIRSGLEAQQRSLEEFSSEFK